MSSRIFGHGGRSRCVVLLLRHPNRVVDRSERGLGERTVQSRGVGKRGDVGEQDLFLLRHVGIQHVAARMTRVTGAIPVIRFQGASRYRLPGQI